MKLLIAQLVVFASFLQAIRCEEVCCDEIGCFSDDAPWDHVPVPQCSDVISVGLTMYSRADQDWGEQVTRAQPVPSSFDPSRRSVFLVHGWMHADIIVNWVYDMMAQLLIKEDLNVFVVDWDSIDLWYPQSVADTRVVGADIAWLARHLSEQGGQNPDQMWCIGHSLGGHVCGNAGKLVKLGRITGLDPAGPLWESYSPANPLSSDDANFVDVIHSHTQPGLVLALGFHAPLGHVDFYPNGGGWMPGCIIDPYSTENKDDPDYTPACSHFRAIDYFYESVNSDCKFTSRRRCSNYLYLPGSCWPCDGDVCQVLGYDADQSSRRGVFYLETNDAAPYCQG